MNGFSGSDVNHEAFQVLDAIDDLVLVKGPKSRIIWANKAFRTYYAMTAEEWAVRADDLRRNWTI